MANLTYTVKETVTINGKVVGNEIAKVVSGVNRYQQYTMTVSYLSTTDIAVFGATAEYGVIKNGDLKYIRITNLDGTNFITVTPSETVGPTSASFVVQPGGSFILTADTLNNNQIVVIRSLADTADCEIEVFIGIA